MSIKERIEDGNLLFVNGRLDGALLCTLIAVAATVRKRYPLGSKRSDGTARGDRACFEDFLRDELPALVGNNRFVFAFDGAHFRFEELLYTFVRCCLAHEAQITPNIFFEYGDFLVDKKGTEDCLWFSSELVIRLSFAVSMAPENKELFPELHGADAPLGPMT